MCRTGGRRCPAYKDPEKIAERNARRRAAYAMNKGKKKKTAKPSDFKEKDPIIVEDNEFLTNLLNQKEEPVKKKAAPKKTPTKKTTVKKTVEKEESLDKVEQLKVWTEAEMDKSLKAHLAKEKEKEKNLEEELTKKTAPKKKPVKKPATIDKSDIAPSETIMTSSGKGKTKTVLGSKSIELSKNDGSWESKKYTAAKLFKTTGNSEYNPNLNVDLTEHEGHLVDITYFNKKSISGVLDYTKLAETSDEDLGFNKLGKVYDIKEIRKDLTVDDYMNLAKEEVKGMTKEDTTALNYFTSNNYKWVNNALFQKKVHEGPEGKDVSKESLNKVISSYEHDKESLKKITQHLDEALSKGPKQQRIVYRGVGDHADFLRNEKGNRIKADQWVDQNLEVGKEIKFDGYQSSTPTASGLGGYASSNGIVYEIITPEGVNVESVTAFSGEQEITLPRNARYTVASITKNVDIKISNYSTKTNNTVVRLIAINSKGEVLDGTNSDPIEPITDDYFEEIFPGEE